MTEQTLSLSELPILQPDPGIPGPTTVKYKIYQCNLGPQMVISHAQRQAKNRTEPVCLRNPVPELVILASDSCKSESVVLAAQPHGLDDHSAWYLVPKDPKRIPRNKYLGSEKAGGDVRPLRQGLEERKQLTGGVARRMYRCLKRPGLQYP